MFVYCLLQKFSSIETLICWSTLHTCRLVFLVWIILSYKLNFLCLNICLQSLYIVGKRRHIFFGSSVKLVWSLWFVQCICKLFQTIFQIRQFLFHIVHIFLLLTLIGSTIQDKRTLYILELMVWVRFDARVEDFCHFWTL